ncbi:hypothetical protein ACSFA0_19395 [Variovorax sp. LT1P1]|uniref:hypothetical protein n=1 Tax=Variovorax sp. LT1P1 TaxID=3443730 RepID=UPI003F48F619
MLEGPIDGEAGVVVIALNARTLHVAAARWMLTSRHKALRACRSNRLAHLNVSRSARTRTVFTLPVAVELVGDKL